MLEVEDIQVAYVRRTILRGVSLTVAPGEIVTLLGPNGAGKSTLLKAVAGLAPVTAGTIRFDGRTITGLPPAETRSLGLVYLPQGGQVFAPLSVAEHLSLAAGLPGAHEDPETVLAAFPDLAERRRQAAGSLSGGQKQQLAIAMALLGRPRLLLVDEPSIGLAPRLAAEVLERLQAVRERTGTAVLLVEQNVAPALAAADRAALLVNGQLVAIHPTAEIRADEALRRQYVFGLEAREGDEGGD